MHGSLRVARPGKRGVRVVTNAGRVAMDASMQPDELLSVRTVKSHGPGFPVLEPRSLYQMNSATDGGKKAGPQGECV